MGTGPTRRCRPSRWRPRAELSALDHRFPSGGLTLHAHLARPATGRTNVDDPAVIIVHGYPAGVRGAAAAVDTYPELADRIAAELGWIVLVPALRGADGSEGNFSLGGWMEDVVAAIAHLRATARPGGIWLAGFGTGGALSICAAAERPSVQGVAALGAPADFDDWASHPRRLLEHAREVGMIRDPGFPTSFDDWARELRDLRAVACAPKLAPRPLLVVHGSDDDLVPAFDARVLVDAHGSAELRIVYGAGHRLRHDPRAIAVLLGWLDRTWNQSPLAVGGT